MQSDPSPPRQFPYRRWLAIGALLLGAAFMAFFGLRAYHHYQHMQKMEVSGFRVESLRGWMTLPYMAEQYDVSAEALFSAVGVSMAGNQKLSLRQLIDKNQLDAVEARLSIEKVIQSRQAKPGSSVKSP